jgi:hypothetical protein
MSRQERNVIGVTSSGKTVERRHSSAIDVPPGASSSRFIRATKGEDLTGNRLLGAALGR